MRFVVLQLLNLLLDFSFRNFSSSSSPSPTWRILRLNHIALATQQTDNAAELFNKIFQLPTSEKQPQPDHGVNTVFVELGNTKLELLDPLGDGSPINGFVKKNPNGGVHHLCFEVDNIEQAVVDLKQKGVRLLSDQTKIGAHGKPVIFIHPKDCCGVLVELEQV